MKSGDVYSYYGIRAEVLAVRANGIWIGYWGRGLQDGKRVKRRVSATQLTPWAEK